MVLTAVSGDEQTGLKIGPHAQTRRPRGTAGMRIVRRNAQFALPGLLPADDPELTGNAFGPTWFLLYRRDGDTVRRELSLAKGVSDAGVLWSWKERLILPEIDMLDVPPGGRDRGDDAGPDLDVPVVSRVG